MSTGILKEDHFSTFKNKCRYGSKGEKLKIISQNCHVLIVEGKTGRFPVTEDKVKIIN